MQRKENKKSGFFITFSGNCEKALHLYQSCFGGDLHFNFFNIPATGFKNVPVVNGCLISENICIFGSDLVLDEGRRIGNYISIYFQCENNLERFELIDKLNCRANPIADSENTVSKLIEVIDPFDVRWIFGI